MDKRFIGRLVSLKNKFIPIKDGDDAIGKGHVIARQRRWIDDNSNVVFQTYIDDSFNTSDGVLYDHEMYLYNVEKEKQSPGTGLWIVGDHRDTIADLLDSGATYEDIEEYFRNQPFSRFMNKDTKIKIEMTRRSINLKLILLGI